MRKKFVLLLALAILITVFQRASLQDEGRNLHRIICNVFYPYLTVRYVKKKVKFYRVICQFPISTTVRHLFKLSPNTQFNYESLVK